MLQYLRRKGSYFLPLLVIVSLSDSCIGMENQIQAPEPGIYLYHRGRASLIEEKDGCSSIEFREMLIDALVLSDDLYKMSVSPETIEAEKEDGCLEIIFKEPQSISIGAFDKRGRQIEKILLPLGQICGKGRFDIYFGDPEYDEFNIVINGNPQFKERACSLFKRCIEKRFN